MYNERNSLTDSNEISPDRLACRKNQFVNEEKNWIVKEEEQFVTY